MWQLFGRVQIALLTAGVVFLATSASDSNPAYSAQKGAKKAAAQAQKAASNQQLTEAIQVLNSIKSTLQGADHDYGGHRAAAVADIGKAAHQLREALHAGHKTNPNNTGVAKGTGGASGAAVAKSGGGKGNTNPHPEAQALSDSQLAASIPVLQQTIVALQNTNHDYGGHREKAITDLSAAIQQLGTALKYSKEKDQNKP